jgi:hypothetical protein
MERSKAKQPSQIQKFKQAAREHETDNREEEFAEMIARIAQAPLVPEAKKTSGVPKISRDRKPSARQR